MQRAVHSSFGSQRALKRFRDDALHVDTGGSFVLRLTESTETHSGYPLPGSWLEVEYTPGVDILELSAIADHIPSYATEAIDVETVAQRLATDAAAALRVPVVVNAYYILRGGIELWATCRA